MEDEKLDRKSTHSKQKTKAKKSIRTTQMEKQKTRVFC